MRRVQFLVLHLLEGAVDSISDFVMSSLCAIMHSNIHDMQLDTEIIFLFLFLCHTIDLPYPVL
jgi:hypothetical protein